MKKLIATVAIAPLAIFGLSCAQASNDAPIKPSVLADIAAGTPMRMDYQIKASAWVFILPVTGKANFVVNLNQETYDITSQVKTTGLADILINYNMDLKATGAVSAEGLKTKTYYAQNDDGKKNRLVEMTYNEDSFDMTATPKFGNLGKPPATTEQALDANDPITELINFSLKPRAEGEDPCGGPMKMFDGRQLTHLHFTNHGLKDVRSRAWKGKAYECHVRMVKVAGYKSGYDDNETLSGIDGPIKMWLAPLPNGSTVPVRIEAKTDSIGKVTLQASRLSFTPLSEIEDQ